MGPIKKLSAKFKLYIEQNKNKTSDNQPKKEDKKLWERIKNYFSKPTSKEITPFKPITPLKTKDQKALDTRIQSLNFLKEHRDNIEKQILKQKPKNEIKISITDRIITTMTDIFLLELNKNKNFNKKEINASLKEIEQEFNNAKKLIINSKYLDIQKTKLTNSLEDKKKEFVDQIAKVISKSTTAKEIFKALNNSSESKEANQSLIDRINLKVNEKAKS